MTFAEYFALLQRRWRVWSAGLLLGLLVAGVVTALSPIRYTATAQSFVNVAQPVDSDGQGEIFQGAQFAVQRVKSYAPLVRSPEVLQPVIDELGLATDVRGLGEQVSVSSAPETVLLNVAATDADRQLAARIADAVSRQLGALIEEMETPPGSSASNVVVSLPRPAQVPTDPSSPRTLLNLALGGLAGLALGLVAAVLRHYLDKRVKTSDDVRALTDMSPLGATSFERSARRQPLVALAWRSEAAEQYRTIRTALKFAGGDRELRHFAVTSAAAGEGKTSVTCNLAISWAQSGASVCLVEADLRRPAVSDFLGVDGSLGLSDVLVGERELDEVLCPWHDGMITVLPAGSLPPDPAALLGSSAMASLVKALKGRFDAVIYDTPPLRSVTDAVVLGQQVDGAVLVVRSGLSRRDHVAEAVESLRRARLGFLGTIIAAEKRRGRRSQDYQHEALAETPGLPAFRAQEGRQPAASGRTAKAPVKVRKAKPRGGARRPGARAGGPAPEAAAPRPGTPHGEPAAKREASA